MINYNSYDSDSFFKWKSRWNTSINVLKHVSRVNICRNIKFLNYPRIDWKFGIFGCFLPIFGRFSIFLIFFEIQSAFFIYLQIFRSLWPFLTILDRGVGNPTTPPMMRYTKTSPVIGLSDFSLFFFLSEDSYNLFFIHRFSMLIRMIW